MPYGNNSGGWPGGFYRSGRKQVFPLGKPLLGQEEKPVCVGIEKIGLSHILSAEVVIKIPCFDTRV